MLSISLLASTVLPAPLTASEVVVTGGSTANILYGKLQRAAQLPTTRLSPTPIAAVDNRGALSKALWSSFSMSAVPSGYFMEPERVIKTTALVNALIFLDQTITEDKGMFGGFTLPFGEKKQPPAAGAVDLSVLEAAGARRAAHAFVMVEASSVAPWVEAFKGLGSCCPVTLLAPADGVTLASTKGWVQEPVQDHEGVLVNGISVQQGYAWDDEKGIGTVLPCSGAVDAMAREDFAELCVQCALRLSHTADESAPPLRVVRVSPGSVTVQRPIVNSNSVIGGPKLRAAQGTVESADWSALLAPFGVIKESDSDDWRLLVDK
eukprot:CAMPEP_0183337594 /NCGR_PEP_ID=MMETSP0164_2-20130417/5175_1 /TAXON_ID=221442 /ORGANISM="Coccolithus pelagicus ssp braarudi, Strain PLY182g" /LENGTH=320 /DNA_ID=CAMNT_0025507303 /DNA_START=1 /DNA_END=963 /DNA_ORIENTATION=+